MNEESYYDIDSSNGALHHPMSTFNSVTQYSIEQYDQYPSFFLQTNPISEQVLAEKHTISEGRRNGRKTERIANLAIGEHMLRPSAIRQQSVTNRLHKSPSPVLHSVKTKHLTTVQ